MSEIGKTQKTGRRGEEEAVKFLRNKGYQIVERNVRSGLGELDIVCRFKSELIFVEVKAKVGEIWGSPEEMVNQRKLNKLRLLAENYQKGFKGTRRIDVVAVVFGRNEEVERIEHYDSVS